jgi:hypothetical protein
MIDEDIALVRRARPDDPPHDPAVKARAWARLHAEFDAPPAPRRRTLSRRVAWRLAATGVVAVGAAAAVVAIQIGRSAPQKAPQAGRYPTVWTLELAAQAVEKQTVPRPRADQWVYSPELRSYAMAPGNQIRMLRGKVKVETWWRFDGTRIAESTQGGKLYTKRVLRPGEKIHPPVHEPGINGGYVSGPGIWRSSPRGLYDYVAKLPTEPDALLAKIRHDTKDAGHDVSTFGRIEQILGDDKLIPPKANAALYRALAKISGVTVVPGVKDFAGRLGVAVTRTEQGNRIEIILDPGTYRYLGTRTVAAKDQTNGQKVIFRAGQVLNDTADLAFRVVDQPGQRG